MKIAIETELQTASIASYKLYALLKAAAFSAEELETDESKEIFKMALSLSEPVTTYLQRAELEVSGNE